MLPSPLARLLVLSGFCLTACATADPEDDVVDLAANGDPTDEDIDPLFFENEGASIIKNTVSTVDALARSGACSTAPARVLSLQIAQELACARPGMFERIDRFAGVSLTEGALPILQPVAANGLRQAAGRAPVRVNSSWRSLAQQYLLKRWEGRCGIRVAAAPGRSNHESGLAIDTSDYGSQAVRNALRAYNLSWYCSTTNGGRTAGCGDPVHFTSGGGQDLRAYGVAAFQRLWNRNHPEDPIATDGAYGPDTERRLKLAPLAGFARVAQCGVAIAEGISAGGNAPAAPNACPADLGAGRCEGNVATRCANDQVVRTDCGWYGQACVAGAGGAPTCAEADAPAQPQVCAGGIDARGTCTGNAVARCNGGRVVYTDCQALGATCAVAEGGAFCEAAAAPPPGDACPPGVDARGRCSGDRVQRCVGGRLSETDCARFDAVCDRSSGDAVCAAVAQPAAPADPCAGVPRDGQCRGEVAVWCDANGLRSNDCALRGETCRYVDATLGYWCAPREAPAPVPSPDDDAPGVEDVDYAARGECRVVTADPFTPADTGGPAGETFQRCYSRVTNAGLNPVDCRSPAGDGPFFLTTFGGGSDTQPVACGGRNADGNWYYAANAQRFPCGSRFRLRTARGCVVVEVADVGPHVCVEDLAGGPIWDVSPLAARILTGNNSAGWSEHVGVTSESVAAGTALGRCN